MRFADRLAAGQFALALEITPPQKPLPKVLLRRARLLGNAVQAINVIQRPGRQSSLDASCDLHEAGLEPCWHLVTRGRSHAEIQADLDHAASHGISQVLCILGDHTAADVAGGPTIKEVVAMTRATLPDATIGATLNQYGRDPEAVLGNLLPKLRAGATYVQTQPAFDAALLEPFAAAIDGELPDTRVIAMAMPLLSAEAGERIERRLGIQLPETLRDVLASGDEGRAWDAFAGTLESLVQAPHVDGVAIMTFEMDAGEAMGERILEALRRAGAL